MKVIVKQVGKSAEIVEVDYKYRNEVGKLIDEGITNEYVHIVQNELAMVVDEDGLPKELPFNFLLSTNSPHYPIQAIVGTVVFCRYQWENPWEKEIYDYELMDVTEQDIERVNELLSVPLQAELGKEFMRFNGR